MSSSQATDDELKYGASCQPSVCEQFGMIEQRHSDWVSGNCSRSQIDSGTILDFSAQDAISELLSMLHQSIQLH